MLKDFLGTHREEIPAITEEKTKNLAGVLATSDQLKLGLPVFYEQLINVLDKKLGIQPPEDMLLSAAAHGKEFLRLGYSLSHVVHSYGAMCQAITELADVRNARISSFEFNILNGCLDVAIASALSSAAIAHEMIKAGLVGAGGEHLKSSGS